MITLSHTALGWIVLGSVWFGAFVGLFVFALASKARDEDDQHA